MVICAKYRVMLLIYNESKKLDPNVAGRLLLVDLGISPHELANILLEAKTERLIKGIELDSDSGGEDHLRKLVGDAEKEGFIEYVVSSINKENPSINYYKNLLRYCKKGGTKIWIFN